MTIKHIITDTILIIFFLFLECVMYVRKSAEFEDYWLEWSLMF